MKPRFSEIIFLLFILIYSSQALAILDCNNLITKAGQLVSAQSIIDETANQLLYLKEFLSYHVENKTEGYVLSSVDTIKTLESEFGPPITFTTFSRELNPQEHYRLTEQVLGVLSNLPPSGVMIVSGGTMGERGVIQSIGGGVGIVQSASMNLGFKTLSITSSKAFQYKAAHADYLFFTQGEFSSESRIMYENSKALVMLGGGGQAYNEALEYLQFNPQGLLIVIDAPEVGGSSKRLLDDSRFSNLAKIYPNLIIARNGSEAGVLITEKLGLRKSSTKAKALAAAKKRVNILSPNSNFHLLMPNSKIIGFSGWSNFDLSLPDAIQDAKSIGEKTEAALYKVHHAFQLLDNSLLYATAGNDPKISKVGVPAFETFVHNLPLNEGKGKHIAFTAETVDIKQLNPNISAISFVASAWSTRTYQLPARIDLLVTAGGNKTVIDQSIQAANLKLPHLHILGANTLTDMRIEGLKNTNPNLVVLSPEAISQLSEVEILSKLGLAPKRFTLEPKWAKLLGVNSIPLQTHFKISINHPQATETIQGTLEEIVGDNLFIKNENGESKKVHIEKIEKIEFISK